MHSSTLDKFHKLLKHSKLVLVNNGNCRNFHKSSTCLRFHEYDPKGPYRDEEARRKQRDEWIKGQGLKEWYGVKTGFKDLREEIAKWKNEWHERLTDESYLFIDQGDQDYPFMFRGPDSLAPWQTTCDSDHNEGYSKASLTTSPTGRALFQGYINLTPPNDGKTKKAGYACMSCDRPNKSFMRESYFEWGGWSHLIMKVRGDGRSYAINLNCPGYYDIHWNDIFHYVLYTRGGPYWQTVKIPFSKFVLAAKGRVQDTQYRIPQDQIASIGIAAAKVEGPFCLEIDYIGIELDFHHQEVHAYEQYVVPKGIVDV